MTSFDFLKKQTLSSAVYFQKLTKRDEKPDTNEAIVFNMEVEKYKTYKEFYQDICIQMGVEPEDIAIWKIEYLNSGFERITNYTKQLSAKGSDLIKSVYLENQTNTSSSVQSPNPILLIIPISTSKFGGSKQIFQMGQTGQLEFKNQNESIKNEKRLSTQNDWNKYFSIQEGSLMLIIIKSFEYTKDGVKICFMDYILFKSDQQFSVLYHEITQKKRLDVGTFSIYKEDKYKVSLLSLSTHEYMYVKNIFNQNDYGVIIIAFESKTAKDNIISVTNYYNQIENQIRVRFIFSSENQSAELTNNSNQQFTNQNNVKSENFMGQNYNFSTNPFIPEELNTNQQNNQSNKIKKLNKQSGSLQNNDKLSNNNITQNNQTKHKDQNNIIDNIDKNEFEQQIQNLQLYKIIPTEGLQFEKIFLNSIKYSQLQTNVFSYLKDYFRKQINEYLLQNQSNQMECEEQIEIPSLNLNDTQNKPISNINIKAIEYFLGLNDSYHKDIFFKYKGENNKFVNVPFFENVGCETNLTDLMKLFENTIELYFDFSKGISAKDRDKKLTIECSLYSNTYNKIYPNQILDVDKTSNIQELAYFIKSQRFYRDFQEAEGIQLESDIPPPSTVRLCQLQQDYPNRIEKYFQDTDKLNLIEKESLLRIEIQRELSQNEILFVCHQTTKKGEETFDNPFSFPFSTFKTLVDLKLQVYQILSKRKIIFDGKQIEVNQDDFNLILLKQYSKNNKNSLSEEEFNKRLIKFEIDQDSSKSKCAFIQIQHHNIISSKKDIKFNIF